MCFLVTVAKERNFRHFSKRYVKKSLIYASSVHVGTYSKETHTFPEKEPYQPPITITNYKLGCEVWREGMMGK